VTTNHAKVEQILDLLEELAVDELEQISKALKKMLFRCRVQEKIELRREDVAQRLSEALSHHRMDKVRDDG
jgi:ribosomal protein L29